MIYWKYSENRIFFISEYWILVPTGILINYLALRKFRSDRKKRQELNKLKKTFEHKKKIRRILGLAFDVNGFSDILMRGGADFINVDYIDCGIEEGLRFLDSERLRKIIHNLYRQKQKGKIIYITATAVCHLANQYGQTFLDLPFAIGDFGLTNVYQAARKTLVTILLGSVGPLYVLGGGPLSYIFAAVLGMTGLRLAFTNVDLIATSPIFEMDSVKNLKPRMPEVPDVVVVNSRNKIIPINREQEKIQCWLPDQAFFNPDCQVKVKPTKLPQAIDLVAHDLNYNDVVNMRDVTGLTQVEFSDINDLGKAKLNIPKPKFIK